MNWTPHPIYPIPEGIGRSRDGRGIFRLEGKEVLMGVEELRRYYTIREERIRQAKEDPLNHGFELAHWADADALLREKKVLCIFGGNRAGKTEYGCKRAMQMLSEKDNANVLFLQNNELSSVQLHQRTVWKYFPPEWRALKKSSGGNIRFDPKTGFSDNIFTTPIGGTAIFGNYGQELDKYEGLEFDLIVADENLPLEWYKGLLRGLATRGGSLIWLFTPIDGMTPAISEVAGGAVTRTSRPVDPDLLDPAERHVLDCPEGEMPYIAEKGNIRIIYFHSILNPFGGYVNLKELYGRAEKSVRERRFYGYARKTVRVLFPKFCQHHIVPEERMAEQLKKKITRYHVADPAGARNMFMLWCAVDPEGRHYIYREWPDVPRYGEWAVQSEDARRWDGDTGPAQPSLGHGVVDYKRLILTEEGNVFGEKGWEMTGEHIWERRVDPRSGAAQSVSERDGGASLIDRFEDEQVTSRGIVDGPSLIFIPAPGLPENEGIHGNQEGITGINDLLAFDETQPITPLINEPKLYISDACENLIWALQNYTGHDGSKAACKDPIDCLRYLVTSDLDYLDDQTLGARGGGYY